MPTTVEVRFKGNRKDYFLWSDDTEPLRLQEAVIVPVDRGLDFGRITAVGETATKKCASSWKRNFISSRSSVSPVIS